MLIRTSDEPSEFGIDYVIEFLLEKELLNSSVIVDNDITVVPSQGRNRNFALRVGHNEGFFLKRYSSTARQHREATAIAFLSNADPRCRDDLPRVLLVDVPTLSTVFELLTTASTLAEYQKALSNPPVLERTYEKLGSALGRLHSASEHRNVPVALLHESRQPRSSTLFRPTIDAVAEISRANCALLAILEQEGLTARYAAIRRHCTDVIVHNDMKAANVLIAGRPTPETVVTVDWEGARVGEAEWDLAGIIQDLIARHLHADAALIDGVVSMPCEADLCRYCTAFLRGYGVERQASLSHSALTRIAELMGVRLAQTAFESQFDADELQPFALVLAQLSATCVTTPEAVASTLFTT